MNKMGIFFNSKIDCRLFILFLLSLCLSSCLSFFHSHMSLFCIPIISSSLLFLLSLLFLSSTIFCQWTKGQCNPQKKEFCMIHLSILTVLPLWQTIYKTTKFAILPNYPIIFRKGVITIWNSCQWQPNGTNGNPLAPTAIDLMAPMVHPIAIGANDDCYWR